MIISISCNLLEFELNWNIRTANYVYVFYGALYFIGIYGIFSQFKWFHEAMRVFFIPLNLIV